jgi:ribosomal protein L9
VRVDLVRVSDGYARSFSVKTNKELGRSGYCDTFVETAQDQELRIAKEAHATHINSLWSTLAQAANGKDFTTASATLAQLATATLAVYELA